MIKERHGVAFWRGMDGTEDTRGKGFTRGFAFGSMREGTDNGSKKYGVVISHYHVYA